MARGTRQPSQRPAPRRNDAPPPAGSAPWIFGFRGPQLPGPLARAIQEGRIAGLILFRDNLGPGVASALELRREILSLVPAGRPFVLTADEEGGLITQTSRLRLPGGPAWPATPTPRALGRLGDPRQARFVGRLLGRRLRSLGITSDLAPCLDLDVEPENPVIASRSFGAEPAQAALLGGAFADGLARAGVAACFKHYPGHGGTLRDSHRELPRMDPRSRALHEAPFRACLLGAAQGALAGTPGAPRGTQAAPRGTQAAPGGTRGATWGTQGAPWGTRGLPGGRSGAPGGARGASCLTHGLLPWLMSAHVDWGHGLPATLDARLLARAARWGPSTLRITDALEMAAVSLERGAAEAALLAGNDLLLVAREWELGLEAMAASDRQTGARGAAWRRAGARAWRRVGPVWEALDARRVRLLPPEESPADRERLRRLHRAAVAWDEVPGAGAPRSLAALPEGPWVWIVPEGLGVYARLAGWRPPPGRRRRCARLLWVPESATPGDIRALAAKAAATGWPVLWATMFRGRPPEAVRELFAPLLGLAGLRVVAHLLDELWPSSGGDAADPVASISAWKRSSRGRSRETADSPSADGSSSRFLVARTSGPSADALDALAEALAAAE